MIYIYIYIYMQTSTHRTSIISRSNDGGYSRIDHAGNRLIKGIGLPIGPECDIGDRLECTDVQGIVSQLLLQNPLHTTKDAGRTSFALRIKNLDWMHDCSLRRSVFRSSGKTSNMGTVRSGCGATNAYLAVSYPTGKIGVALVYSSIKNVNVNVLGVMDIDILASRPTPFANPSHSPVSAIDAQVEIRNAKITLCFFFLSKASARNFKTLFNSFD